MASTDTTTKPKQPDSSKVDGKPETQDPSTGPSTAGHLKQAASGLGNLTDPAMEETETLRASSPSWEYVSNGALIKRR